MAQIQARPRSHRSARIRRLQFRTRFWRAQTKWLNDWREGPLRVGKRPSADGSLPANRSYSICRNGRLRRVVAIFDDTELGVRGIGLISFFTRIESGDREIGRAGGGETRIDIVSAIRSFNFDAGGHPHLGPHPDLVANELVELFGRAPLGGGSQARDPLLDVGEFDDAADFA